MKIIAIAAVTAGGKTKIVNEIKKQLKNVESLHFDDYSFEGEVDDFYSWVMQGANYNVWNLNPLIKDICEIQKRSKWKLICQGGITLKLYIFLFRVCKPMIFTVPLKLNNNYL